jgi:3-oxoacyl-[acyl-carrier protein] reductase
MRKVAVVTGCSYGLGFEIADRLIDEGYFVCGLSRSQPPMKLFSAPDTFQWIECDVSNAEEVKLAFEKMGVFIDVLVNNAGVFEYGEFSSQSMKTIDKIIDINVKGTMYVTKAAQKYLSRGSNVFFINSVAGLYEIKNEAIYAASKHALTAFAGILGEELRNDGIKVTSIHPGGIDTPMQRTNPIKKELLQPSEISNLIVNVINSKATYKTIKLFPESEWHQ